MGKIPLDEDPYSPAFDEVGYQTRASASDPGTPPLPPSREEHKVRRRLFLLLALAMLAATSVIFGAITNPSVLGYEYDKVEACTAYPALLSLEVDQVATIDVVVIPGKCPTFDILKMTGAATGRNYPTNLSGQSVLVGPTNRLRLVNQLSSVQIAPITNEVQAPIDVKTLGTWAWQIKATDTGPQDLSLILDQLDEQGGNTFKENARIPIALEVQGTFWHSVKAFGASLAAFFTSIAGMVTSLIVVGGGAGTFLAWWRKRKKHETEEVPTPKNAEDDANP